MFASERHQAIMAIARADGRVDVASLVERFGVTAETVRRDLSRLEEMRLVHRVHGGAVPVERLHSVPSISQRSETMAAEKQAIASAALDEIPAGGAVLIDAGTTTARLAELFPADRELTIVTNSLDHATVLVDKPNLTIFQLGGRVRGTHATVDAWALGGLGEVSVDVAFMGTYGISPKHGMTTPDPSEGAVKRLMAAAARRVVLLADSSKIGTDHLSIWGSPADVDVLITDENAPRGVCRELRAMGNGLEIRLAATERTEGVTILAQTEAGAEPELPGDSNR